MFWFFGSKSCGVLPPQPGIESTLPALEGDVLTIGSPGEYPKGAFRNCAIVRLKFSFHHMKLIYNGFNVLCTQL